MWKSRPGGTGYENAGCFNSHIFTFSYYLFFRLFVDFRFDNTEFAGGIYIVAGDAVVEFFAGYFGAGITGGRAAAWQQFYL
jgi:hypothetical protein